MRYIVNVGTFLGMALVFVAGGCATTGSGLSDSDQISTLLEEWKAGILEADADRIMATYSENFAPGDTTGYEGGQDKPALRKFVEKSIENGFYEGVEIDMENVDVTIEDGVATAYPIDYTNLEGSVVIELTVTKEKAGWLITDMVVEGM